MVVVKGGELRGHRVPAGGEPVRADGPHQFLLVRAPA